MLLNEFKKGRPAPSSVIMGSLVEKVWFSEGEWKAEFLLWWSWSWIFLECLC